MGLDDKRWCWWISTDCPVMGELQCQGILFANYFRNSSFLLKDRPSTSDARLQAKRHIPGYTGFVRGKQNVAGRTYGETTRWALNKSFEHNLTRSTLPSSPQTKVRKGDIERHAIKSRTSDAKQYIPGYQGFVAGARFQYSHTYGETTRNMLLTQKEYQTGSTSWENRKNVETGLKYTKTAMGKFGTMRVQKR